MKAIYFDMDATIANLYSFPQWLDYLHAEDTTPYEQAEPMENVTQLVGILQKLIDAGVTVGIISWSAKGGSNEYSRRVKSAKMKWCKKYFGNIFQEFHVVKYGTPKYKVAKIKDAILVDDDIQVRSKWKGRTIDASNTAKMIAEVSKLAIDLMAA